MTNDQYKLLVADPPTSPVLVSIAELFDRSERTLLFGYDADRNGFHVYLMDDQIFLHHYGRGKEGNRRCGAFPSGLAGPRIRKSHVVWLVNELIPDKRLYPEACDFEFCKLLINKGISLPFTSWDEARQPKQFHGEL